MTENQSEDRRRIDRWLEIHGRFQCDSCNPHPINKPKATSSKTSASKNTSQSGKGTSASGSVAGRKLKKTKLTNEPAIGSEIEEMGERQRPTPIRDSNKG